VLAKVGLAKTNPPFLQNKEALRREKWVGKVSDMKKIKREKGGGKAQSWNITGGER